MLDKPPPKPKQKASWLSKVLNAKCPYTVVKTSEVDENGKLRRTSSISSNTTSHSTLRPSLYSGSTKRGSVDTPGAKSTFSTSSGRTRSTYFLQGAKDALEASVTVLGLVPIPNLDIIPSSLLTFIQMYEDVDDNEDNLTQLKSIIDEIIDIVIKPMEDWKSGVSEEFRNRCDQFCRSLDEQCLELSDIARESGASKFFLSEDDRSRIDDVRSVVDNSIRAFLADSAVQTRIEVHKTFVEMTLQKLPVAKADYVSVPKDECAPNTRVGSRNRIIQHLSDPRNRLVWLTGSPGAGKTAIAKSVATYLDQNERLAASFFFDKSGVAEGTDTPKLFVSTIARQLAELHPPYRRALFQILESDRRAMSFYGHDQLRTLIIDPMEKATKQSDASDKSFVIVLDGLDECGDPRTLEKLMMLVLELLDLPNNFQILVSSREESEISDALSRYPARVPAENLDDIPDWDTVDDIFKYIQLTTSAIPSRGSDSWPPSTVDMQHFAEQCGGFFEVARIRLRILEDSRGAPLCDLFQELLTDSRRGLAVFEAEYLRVLQNAYPKPTPCEDADDKTSEDMDKEIWRRFRIVVGALVALRQQLHITSLSALLRMTQTEVSSVLRPISALIKVPPKASKPIQFSHTMCREFFIRKASSNKEHEQFLFHDTKGTFLAPLCLELMIKSFHPGHLTTLYCHNNPTHRQGMLKLPRHLTYALHHWTDHLDLNDAPEAVWVLLRTFMSKYFVAWVEAMVWADVIDMASGVSRVGKHRKELKRCMEDLAENLHELPPDDAWMRDVLDHTSVFLNRSTAFQVQSSSISPFFPVFEELSLSLHKLHHHRQSRLFRGPTISTHIAQTDSATNQAESESQVPPRDSQELVSIQRSALSADGRLVAMSSQAGELRVVNFESGELAWTPGCEHAWNSKKLPSFVWLEFALKDSCVVGEDAEGMVWLVDKDGVLDVIGPLRNAGPDTVAAVSSDGSHIIRVSQQTEANPSGREIILLSVLNGRLCLRPLASASGDARSTFRIVPRSLGFSPDGTHVGVFDEHEVNIWSVVSAANVSTYEMKDVNSWHINLVSTQGPTPNENLTFYPSPPAAPQINETEPLPSIIEKEDSGRWLNVNTDSAVYVEVPLPDDPQAELNPRVLTSFLGPQYLMMEDAGRIRLNGQIVIALPLELAFGSGRRLQYRIRDGQFLLLVGGELASVPQTGGDKLPVSVFVPPIVINLSEVSDV